MRINVRDVPNPLPNLGHIPSLLQRLYAARGIESAEELDRSLAQLIPYQHLKGIEAAVALLATALEQQQRILVIGDFDADGATASVVSLLGLRQMGAAHVDYLVPNRFEYGYGLTPEIVAEALKYRPELLITVDNGISSFEGVAAAHAAGLKVIITDHHSPGLELPAADALVNPNQPGCAFPSKCIAGVGVIFYVLMALRAHLRASGWFTRSGCLEPNLAELLDLVALGSIADVVPLDTNNRILVHQGLARLKAGRTRPGILAILEVAGRDLQQLTASDLGFVIGPRLNAAGRLDDMALGIECLLCDDPHRAKEIAIELDQLNKDRKAIEQGMQREALTQLKDWPSEPLPLGLCLFDPDWHQGVVGILASRLKERYHRPVIAFAEAGEGSLKGSARSVPGLHIRDVIDSVATEHPGLIQHFGGHAMAAGLSLPKAHLAEFIQAFESVLARQLTEEELGGCVLSDGILDSSALTLESAHMLCQAGPWGAHFPEPLFHGVFQLLEQRVVGGRHLKLTLATLCGTLTLEAIAFNVDLELWPNPQIRRVLITYHLEVNVFRGRERVQLRVTHLESSPDESSKIAV